MKTVLNYRNAAIALLTVFAVALAPAAHATDDKNPSAIELKFLGNFRNNPVFELTIANPGNEKEFVINIRDEYGNSLYREVLTNGVLSKKFLLNTDEIGNEPIRFEVTGKKSNKTVVYEVNQDSRVVEETRITKLDK